MSCDSASLVEAGTEAAEDDRDAGPAANAEVVPSSSNSPEGSSRSSLEGVQPQAQGILTKEMLDVERMLHEVTAKQEEQRRKEGNELIEKETDRDKKERFHKLADLLSRSSVYTSYLAQRMEKQKAQEQARIERSLKRYEQRRNLLKQKDVNTEKAETRAKKKDESIHASGPLNAQVPSPEVQAQFVSPGRLLRGRKRKHFDWDEDDEAAEEEYDAKRIKLYGDQSSEKKTTKEKGNQKEKEKEKEKQKERENKKQKEEEKENKQNTASTEKETNEGEFMEEVAIEKLSKAYLNRTINGEPVSIEQPILFEGGILRDYQLEGYKWLKVIYENGINGILADEMGLGKTIQCIACICKLVEGGVVGPFLIVAPLSTVPNWVAEFERFAPKLPVILYHGPKDERRWIRNQMHRKKELLDGFVYMFPVMVTSYEIAMNDRKHIACFPWKHIIIDEGHRMKNFQCKLVKEMKSYESSHRLLLTGTPLQNNLSELWSLLNFLIPEIFGDLACFQSWFDMEYLESEAGRQELVQEHQQNNTLGMLHKILAPFMLRRVKSDVELRIPPKREVLVYAPLTALQRKYYEAAVNKTILAMVQNNQNDKKVEYDKNGRPKREAAGRASYELMLEQDEDEQDVEDWAEALTKASTSSLAKKTESSPTSMVNIKVRNILMLLRKSCNHAYLLEYPLTSTGEFKIDEDLVKASGKFLLLDAMLTQLKKDKHKVLIFSQMTSVLDLLHDFCYLRKYKFARLDGSMKVQERKEQMDMFNNNKDAFLFLLSTRAGGLGINLTAADTVIIFDSDWNPQADLQAQDRCHRIGQTKPVMIYRLVTANTIDQRIVEKACNKRTLEKMVIHRGKFKKGIHETGGNTEMSEITQEELLSLLKASHFDEVVHEEVISKKHLENLLDRSDLYTVWEAHNSGKDAVASKKGKTTKKSKTIADVQGVFKVVSTETPFPSSC